MDSIASVWPKTDTFEKYTRDEEVFDEVMVKPHGIMHQTLFLIWFQGHAQIRKKKKNKVLRVEEERDRVQKMRER